ncbi:hypothetical protein NT017_16280 [Prolixibacter sp. NT017]|nr:hypothetical protein NT017_16280 [Prolixibacter sp. NT017]
MLVSIYLNTGREFNLKGSSPAAYFVRLSIDLQKKQVIFQQKLKLFLNIRKNSASGTNTTSCSGGIVFIDDPRMMKDYFKPLFITKLL